MPYRRERDWSLSHRRLALEPLPMRLVNVSGTPILAPGAFFISARRGWLQFSVLAQLGHFAISNGATGDSDPMWSILTKLLSRPSAMKRPVVGWDGEASCLHLPSAEPRPKRN